jgi:hypothetical protein
VGSAYDRKTYGFSVVTTPEDDAELISIFNDRRNVEHYNGAFRNCADFARVLINRVYPHAIRRNFIADFGLTTPKSVARALTHYATKHPRAGLQVFVIPQVKGSLPRSHGVEGVTESLIKRYSVPLVVLSPIATAIVFVAYMGHGRFNMPHDAPVLDLRLPETEMAEDADSATGESTDPTTPATPGSARIPLREPLPASVALPPATEPAPPLPALLTPSLPAVMGAPAAD